MRPTADCLDSSRLRFELRSDPNCLHINWGERCDQKYYQCHRMQVQPSDVLGLVAFVAHDEIQFEVPLATSIWLLVDSTSESDSVPSVQKFLN